MSKIEDQNIPTGLKCIICNSPQLKKIRVNKSFGVNIVECCSCNFVQSEYVSDKTLDEYYKNYYLDLDEEKMVQYGQGQSKQGESQVIYIKEICADLRFANVLDYGASLGKLAERLVSISDKVYVVEYNPVFIEILDKMGMFVVLNKKNLFNHKFENYFDLITISHILEHMPDPLALLDNFSYILKKNAYLMVDLPNEVLLLKGHNFQAFGHLHYFTIESLVNMINTQGKFEILDIRHCNRTVRDFIDSRFKLQEDYSITKSEDGTVIRAMLRNIGNKGPSERCIQKYADCKGLLDDYSLRVFNLHNNLELVKQEYLKMRDKIKKNI